MFSAKTGENSRIKAKSNIVIHLKISASFLSKVRCGVPMLPHYFTTVKVICRDVVDQIRSRIRIPNRDPDPAFS